MSSILPGFATLLWLHIIGYHFPNSSKVGGVTLSPETQRQITHQHQMQTGLIGHHALRYQYCEMRQRKMHALDVNLTDQISVNCRINQMSTNKNSYVALWWRGHLSKDWKELEGSGPLVEVRCYEPCSRQVGHTAVDTHTAHSTKTSLLDLQYEEEANYLSSQHGFSINHNGSSC